MYQRILVALDLSPLSPGIFSRALAIAEQGQGKMLLLHVLSADEENSPMPLPSPAEIPLYPAGANDLTLRSWQEQWERYKQEGLDLLNFFAKEADGRGISVEFQQQTGQTGDCICHWARDWRADLVVVGRRGRSGFSEMLLGSVSNYVLHHAPCSVLIVQ